MTFLAEDLVARLTCSPSTALIEARAPAGPRRRTADDSMPQHNLLLTSASTRRWCKHRLAARFAGLRSRRCRRGGGTGARRRRDSELAARRRGAVTAADVYVSRHSRHRAATSGEHARRRWPASCGPEVAGGGVLDRPVRNDDDLAAASTASTSWSARGPANPRSSISSTASASNDGSAWIACGRREPKSASARPSSPGGTACYLCYRMRAVACAGNPEEEFALTNGTSTAQARRQRDAREPGVRRTAGRPTRRARGVQGSSRPSRRPARPDPHVRLTDLTFDGTRSAQAVVPGVLVNGVKT